MKYLVCLLAVNFLVVNAYAEDPKETLLSTFNPKVSLILDGRYTNSDSDELDLPGFQLGGEAGLSESGFSTGHNELIISSNVDDKLYGQLNAAIVYENNETTVELEEAYLETLGSYKGVKVKAGKFNSGAGYLNRVHGHAQDFVDRPLVYDAIFGGNLNDTGVQVRWQAPTTTYLDVGAEVTRGSEYPSGANDKNNTGLALFAKTGGDISEHSSWQLGASYYQAKFDSRESGGHSHAHGGGEEESNIEHTLNDGDVDVTGVDFVYKWAPNGNSKHKNFKFQTEYFVRNENAQSEFVEGDESATAKYKGKQQGYYAQAVYQFRPSWRVGARYDRLKANNTLDDFQSGGIDKDEYLEESGLVAEDSPNKKTIMMDYAPSHFSRVRLQHSQLDSGHSEESGDNNITTLQYIISLGEHGAHAF